MKKAILSGRGLVKHFDGATILNQIDIDVYEGDFTVVMGASGSGKSTLLYALSGMDAPDEGTLTYRGRDLKRLSENEMSALRANDFGFVFQKTHLVSNLTLRENILLAGYVSNAMTEKQARSAADALIAHMRLEGAKDRLPSAVSGGEAQRAAMARAVIANPAVLFADEPTGALNRANSGEVLDLLTSLHRQGQTILLVTHDQEAALRGERILYLEDGALTGELSLAPYDGRARERDQQLHDWLTGLRW